MPVTNAGHFDIGPMYGTVQSKFTEWAAHACTRITLNLCTCILRLIHMWDMTHSYVGHDSFICGT